MSTAAKAHEPTMEEILASIRRIISDDEPGQPVMAQKTASKAATAKAPPPPPEPEADAADGLGQDDIDAMFASFDAPAVEEAPKAAAPEPVGKIESFSGPEELDVLELTEDMADEEPVITAAAPQPIPEPAPVPVAPPQPAAAIVSAPQPRAETADTLLSAAQNEAVSGAFNSLANTILANNARTLDDLVKDMLRPMLRSWLDDNLPPLVERLVRAEIERVARGGR